MPRTARIIIPNVPHNVFQRTISNRKVFLTDKDYQTYMEMLRENARYYKVEVLAYCLLPKSLHLVLLPKYKDSLAKAVGRTNFSYTQYFNSRRKSKGQLWRNRFQSCALDDDYLQVAVQFIENLPLREGLVGSAEKYHYSSAKAHLSGKDEQKVLSFDHWPKKLDRQQWRTLLKRPPNRESVEKLRTYTQTGRPLGGDKFVTKLEKKLKMRLHPLPVGRPPKK